jgi:putative spermidine/putrescine transport system permease protein
VTDLATDVVARGPARRSMHWSGGTVLIRLIAYIVIAMLVAPLVVIVGASFAQSSYVEFPPKALSLQWYSAFVADHSFLAAFELSGEVAALAALCATILGLPASFVLVRKRFPGWTLLWQLLLSPLILPQIVMGLALLQMFSLFGLSTSFLGLVIAHTVAVVPYVVRTTSAALLNIDPRIEEAAADLGAGQLTTITLVVAPMIKGGVLAGALFAFIMSWINVEISIFLSETGTYTLPVLLYNFLEYSITTVVIVAAAMGIYVAVALVLLIDGFIGIDTAAKL